MTIGERIKSRRKQLGLSAEDIARRVNVSPATIYRYESSEIMAMRSDRLAPIAQALQTSPAYLMGWTDDPDARDSPAGSPAQPQNGMAVMLENLRRSPGRRTMFSLTKNVDEKKLSQINRVIEAMIGTDDDDKP